MDLFQRRERQKTKRKTSNTNRRAKENNVWQRKKKMHNCRNFSWQTVFGGIPYPLACVCERARFDAFHYSCFIHIRFIHFCRSIFTRSFVPGISFWRIYFRLIYLTNNIEKRKLLISSVQIQSMSQKHFISFNTHANLLEFTSTTMTVMMMMMMIRRRDAFFIVCLRIVSNTSSQKWIFLVLQLVFKNYTLKHSQSFVFLWLFGGMIWRWIHTCA